MRASDRAKTRNLVDGHEVELGQGEREIQHCRTSDCAKQ
jgi:hypothetical protein